jgi:hypothetical protein
MITNTINAIASILGGKLPWIDNAYGKAYTLYDSEGRIYPAAHLYGNEYVSLLPNDTLGNYLFFEIEDPSIVVGSTQEHFVSSFRTNLIVWFNIESVYGPVAEQILTDSIKKDIVLALAPKFYPMATINVLEVYESAENIFRYYPLTQVNTQFLMLPYYGFRFVLNIKEKTIC